MCVRVCYVFGCASEFTQISFCILHFPCGTIFTTVPCPIHMLFPMKTVCMLLYGSNVCGLKILEFGAIFQTEKKVEKIGKLKKKNESFR